MWIFHFVELLGTVGLFRVINSKNEVNNWFNEKGRNKWKNRIGESHKYTSCNTTQESEEM